jgi:hypothetical protein
MRKRFLGMALVCVGLPAEVEAAEQLDSTDHTAF